MSIITLTSDYGLRDHFVASLKSLIYQHYENCRIIDISHQISTFKVAEAAALHLLCKPFFPEKSIHLICINENPPNSTAKILCSMVEGQYYISFNNGFIPSINFFSTPVKVVEIPVNSGDRHTWKAQTLAKAAASLARGASLTDIGIETQDIGTPFFQQPFAKNSGQLFVGQVIFIDEYGNVVTNFHKKLFEKILLKSPFEIIIRNHATKKIIGSYDELSSINESEMFAIFNASGFLELGLKNSANTHQPKGYAKSIGISSLFGIKHNDLVNIHLI